MILKQFSFNSTAQKKQFNINGFLGADFTSNPENADFRRSPDCPNMIRDTPGKNKKRLGYLLTHTFSEEINGIHIFQKDENEKFLVHAGTSLYLKGTNGEYTQIYSKMNNKRSCSAVLSGRLIILDGATMLSYDGETVTDIKDSAYVPTVVIGRAPSGGGTLYEPINMISNYRIEKFTGDGKSTRYYVSGGDFNTVHYIKERKSGEWVYLKLSIDYDFDETKGLIKFNTAPPAPTDGEDNILICYMKYNLDYRKIIYSCNICTLYGINGALDRIFVTGCPDYPNRDYYCQMEDPTYWGDTWYSNLGRSDTPIIGYSLAANCLAAHKAGEESNANVILRTGIIKDNEPSFPITGTYWASGAVASDTFDTLDNEPVYLSSDGICAITPSDVLGERSSQVRSFYLNGRLLKEENLKNASAVSYKGFYMLLINGKMYILDGLQSITSASAPFSHRQYEGYFWDDIPGKFLFTDQKYLYFAAEGGKLYRFYTDEENIYTDAGKPYTAYWETMLFTGGDFARYKTITGIDISVSEQASTLLAEYQDADGNWVIAAQGNENDKKLLCRKIHIKDCPYVKFRIRNSSGNSLKINKIQISYISGRNIR